MKQITTLSLFFLGIFASFAQFTASTDEGDAIVDGSSFMFHDVGDVNGKITFNVTNTASSTIKMKIEFVSMNNADGSGTFLCLFGNCLAPGGIVPGNVYTGPDNTIAVGETSTTDNHFYNTYLGDGTNYPIEYVFRLFQVDDDDNEIGDSITFTYKYDGTAAIEDLNQIEYTVYPIPSNDFVNITLKEDAKAELINTQGQRIKRFNLKSGKNSIDISALSKQMYYLILTNNQGEKALTKLIFN